MTSKPTVRVERSFAGPVDDLWWLWTTKEGFESWWGPEGFRVEVLELDLRVGGELVYDMIAATPEHIEFMKKNNMSPSHATHGRFVEIVPLRRLGLIHVIDFVPGIEPYEHRMWVEFEPAGRNVNMVVTIHPHTTPEWTRRATAGFESQLTKVPAALTARRAASAG